MERNEPHRFVRRFAVHGWIGLGLIALFWTLNWTLPGLRTHWGFFPMWLGYCLAVDALVLYRTGTSLLTRSWRRYAGLFLMSAPVWWIFEAANVRLRNWTYLGAEFFSAPVYAAWATLSFTTVIPAVMGTAELVASFEWLKKLPRGPRIRLNRTAALALFLFGIASFGLMLALPRLLFPFLWISLYFILEMINHWLGYRTLEHWLKHGDWRPVASLWVGVLITAFFWEMWNFFAYPKWVYDVPWGDWLHIFEMPLLGYLGYLPFSLELFAVVHFVYGLFGQKESDYIRVDPKERLLSR